MNDLKIPVELINGLAGTVILFLPGYILARTVSRGTDWFDISTEVFAATTAAGGVLVHALAFIWSVSLFDRIRTDLSDHRLGFSTYAEGSAWCLVVLLLVPFALGRILSWLTDVRTPPWLYAILNFAEVTAIARIPDAWTWRFSEMKRANLGSWVRVRLKDNAGYVFGGFGEQSFASSDSAKDLFLETTLATNNLGQPLADAKKTQGAWISGDQIAAIEFFGPGGET